MILLGLQLIIVNRNISHRRIKPKYHLGNRDLSVGILASHLRAFWADEAGISSIEYALLLAFAAGGIVMAAESLSSAVAGQFADTSSCFDGSADANGGSGGGTGDGGGSGGDSGNGAGNGDGFAIC